MEEGYLYLYVQGSSPTPFKLLDYDAQRGGYLGRESTLAELKVTALEIWEPGLQALVPVAFGKDGQRFKGNTPETALRVTGPAVGGGGAAGTAAVDRSPDLCWALVGPGPADPPHLTELRAFMESPPASKIPITMSAMQLISGQQVAGHFVVAQGQLAELVGHSIRTTYKSASQSETDTIIMENTAVVQVILAMDKALPSSRTIGLQTERNKADSTSLMTLGSPSGHGTRPGGVLRARDGVRLLAKWEDKSARHNITAAVADLQANTAAWTPLYYGDAEYLLSFAAAGSMVQFYAIPRSFPHVPMAISPPVSMSDPLRRAELALYCVKFYQLLRAQNNVYTAHVLPAAQDLVKVTTGPQDEKVTRTLYFRTDFIAVQKRIERWSVYTRWTGVDFRELAALYQATAGAQGLVHAVAGPQLSNDKFTVVLQPVGLPHTAATPQNEEELRRAAHGVLHGLTAIHGAQCVHRDLRWPNVATSYDKERWFLLDLEMCVRVDRTQPPAQGLASWTPGTLVEGRYVPASDLHRLGLMLQDHKSRVTSDQGRKFLDSLARSAQELQAAAVTAGSLLGDMWLKCGGLHCDGAGARSGVD